MIWFFTWRKYSGTKRSSLATAVSAVGMFVALLVGIMIAMITSEKASSGIESNDLLIIVGFILGIAAFIGIKVLFRIWTDKIANSK